MAWTTPQTWTNVPLEASALNTHVRDNLNHLYDRIENSASYQISSDYTTTSTSFTDIDGTNLSLTITTNGGAVLVSFFAPVYSSTSGNREACLDVDVDGVRVGGSEGLVKTRFGGATTNDPDLLGFVIRVGSLSAGSHTFKLQWRVVTSATIGIEGSICSSQFFVQEI